MEKTNIVLFVCLFLLYITLCFPVVEKFQRMNYLQMHDYFDEKYGNGRQRHNGTLMRHGFNSNNSNNSLRNRWNSWWNKPRMDNNEIMKRRYDTTNTPKLVGYISSQNTNNNEVFQLFEMFDYKRGKIGYVYRDTKYQDNRDAILVDIDPKLYNGGSLYTGDVINIGLSKEPYVVHIYRLKDDGYGTRYENKNYNDSMEEYGVLNPVDTTIQIDDADRYYILYRQELDARKNRYNYYIKDKRGLLIEFDEKYKNLDTGDKVLIPGKEKYGEYVVNVYNL